jgi:hypothetical protein
LKNGPCMTLSEEPLETRRKEPGLQRIQVENLGRDEFFELPFLLCVVASTVKGAVPPCLQTLSQNCEKRLIASSYLSVLPRGTTRLPFIKCCYQLKWGWSCWNLHDKKEDLDCVDTHARMPLCLAKRSGMNFTNLIFEYFSKICRENSSFIKIWQEWRVFYTKTNVIYDSISLNCS